MVNFINCTPHALRLRFDETDGVARPHPLDLVLEPRKGIDGKPLPARVSTTPGVYYTNINGMSVYGPTTYGRVEGLPDPEPDTYFIVSALVGARPEVAGRRDVLMPGTGPKDLPVRDGEGQIYAITRLIAVAAI